MVEGKPLILIERSVPAAGNQPVKDSTLPTE